MTAPNYRTMGLAVPILEALDPELWRARYAHGVFLGAGAAPATDGGSGSLAERMCRGKKGAKTSALQKKNEAQAQLSRLTSEIPDEVIRWHLRAALSELEMKLGLPMGIVRVLSPPVDPGLVKGIHYDRVEPRRPYTIASQRDWYRIDLPPSVLTVERVRAYWFDQLVWEVSNNNQNAGLFKLEWPRVGEGHIMPSNTTNLFMTHTPGIGGNYGGMQLLHAYRSVPDVWGVDYTVGPFDHYTGTPGQIEAVLVHWVYCVAGILLLSIGGMAKSQGLTSASVSIDGLSRSIGLQASAIYGINSALEEALRRAAERIDWAAIRTYKTGLKLYSMGN